MLDLADVRTDISDHYETLRFADRPYGQYRMTRGDEQPSFYASMDAVLARTIMGEDLEETLTDEQRAAWIAHLQSFQKPDGTYRQSFTHHHQLHVHGMVIGALGPLGGKLEHPSDIHYAPFDTPEKAVSYLENQIDWRKQWTASHQFWGGLHIYSLSALCEPEWETTVFDWLIDNVDPETGWWRKGEQPANNIEGLGGGAHIWPIFEHHERPFPAPEKVIDRILEMQLPDGRFAPHEIGSYMHLDALYGLKYMRSLAPDYRRDEIDAAVEKFAKLLAESYREFLDKQPVAHHVLSLAGAMGLVNQLRPDLFPDSEGKQWSDIFTSPDLYRVRAVESQTPTVPGTR